MAIYRRSSRKPLLIAAAVAALFGLLLGFVAGRATVPSLTAEISAVRAQVTPIATALEVIRTEYPKLLAATTGADAGGATAAFARATATLTEHEAALRSIDDAGTTALKDALTTLSTRIAARAGHADVEAAIDAAEAAAARLAGTRPG